MLDSLTVRRMHDRKKLLGPSGLHLCLSRSLTSNSLVSHLIIKRAPLGSEEQYRWVEWDKVALGVFLPIRVGFDGLCDITNYSAAHK